MPNPAGPRTQPLRSDQQWVIGGRYRVLDRLGQGGMADVFRAHDELLDRDVAVKVFRTEAEAGPLDTNAELRRELELQSLAQLSHPNLITLFDGSVTGDGPGYLVLELVTGRDLASWITDGPVPEPLVRRLGAQLADALAYVHAHGMVHRDVKPANILLGEDGRPDAVRARLSDFGIVRILGRERMTSADLTLGTASYIAPEQARGANAEPPADVYSLGLVLIEALTGRRCFDGPLHEAMAARLATSPEVPAQLPAPWPALLAAMTAMEPAQRPSATQVVDVLREAEVVEPVPAPQPPLPAAAPPVRRDDDDYWDEPAGPERSRRGLVLVLALLAIGAIAAGASYLTWGQGTAPASDPTVVPTAPVSRVASQVRHSSASHVVSSSALVSHSPSHASASRSHAPVQATHASTSAPAPSPSPSSTAPQTTTSSAPSPSPSVSTSEAPAASGQPLP